MGPATKRLEWWLREEMMGRYWMLHDLTDTFELVEATRVRLSQFPELDAATMQWENLWYVIEGATGCRLNRRGCDSVEAAIHHAEERFGELGITNAAELRATLERRIRESGCSPRYELEEVEAEE